MSIMVRAAQCRPGLRILFNLNPWMDIRSDRMSDVKVTVDPGVCKLGTVINAKMSDDMMHVDFQVESTCPHITRLAQEVKSVDYMDIMGKNMMENPFYQAAAKYCPHGACPVPCAFNKALEVAADLGLKRNVEFKIE